MKEFLRSAINYFSREKQLDLIADSVKRATKMGEDFSKVVFEGTEVRFSPARVRLVYTNEDYDDAPPEDLDACIGMGACILGIYLYFAPKTILEEITRKGDFSHLRSFPQVAATVTLFHEYAHHMQFFIRANKGLNETLVEDRCDFLSGVMLAWANKHASRKEPLLEEGEEDAAADTYFVMNSPIGERVSRGDSAIPSMAGIHSLNVDRANLFKLGMRTSINDARDILLSGKDPRTLPLYASIRAQKRDLAKS